MRKDYDFSIAELKAALEIKDKKIIQLEREKRDAEDSIVQKIQGVQVQLRGHQENNYRRKEKFLLFYINITNCIHQ